MKSREIFNPLTALASTSEFKAQASMQNTQVGVCPKCTQNMGTARISNKDQVFYCEGCRVSTPMPDAP